MVNKKNVVIMSIPNGAKAEMHKGETTRRGHKDASESTRNEKKDGPERKE